MVPSIREVRVQNLYSETIFVTLRYLPKGSSEWENISEKEKVLSHESASLTRNGEEFSPGSSIQVHVTSGSINVLSTDEFGFDSESLYIAFMTFKPDKRIHLDSITIPPWQNWSKNITYEITEENYFRPENEKDLRAVLLDATTAGATVRVSGQRHSQAPLVTDRDTENGWIVDLIKYADRDTHNNRILLTDGGNTVTVNAGVREDELDFFLAGNNKILHTVTAGGFFSIGGMTSVDVHGSTIKAPIFAETAIGYNIMGPDGNIDSIIRKDIDSNFDEYHMATANFGALGIVTSVVLSIEDRPYKNTVEAKCISDISFLSEDQFVEVMQPLIDNNQRIETFWNPYSGRNGGGDAICLSWNLVTPDTKIDNEKLDFEFEKFGAPYEDKEDAAQKVGMGIQKSGSHEKAKGEISAAFIEIKKQFNIAKGSYSELWLTKAARTMFMSYFLELPNLEEDGLRKAWRGLEAVKEILDDSKDLCLAAPLEFRFVQGGKALLAGTFTEKESVFVNLDLIGFVEQGPGRDYDERLLNFFAKVEKKWVHAGGLPHHGKMFGFHNPYDPSEDKNGPFNPKFLEWLANSRADRVEKFSKYRKDRDPNGLFYNDFVKALLGDTH